MPNSKANNKKNKDYIKSGLGLKPKKAGLMLSISQEDENAESCFSVKDS